MEKVTENQISIEGFKHRFCKKFPTLEITTILLSEPDEMNVEAFISKVGTWLRILDAEKGRYNYLNNEIEPKEGN